MKKTFKTFALMLLTAFAFSSCVDVPAPYNLPDKSSSSGGDTSGNAVEPKGDGTAASPFNVAAVVAKIKEMAAGEESTVEYYIKGKVREVKTDAATISQYGNHTFTMVDEGDNSTVFTAFQVYGPDKKKFTSVDDIKVGDEVVVCGKVVNYRGNTPETVGKGAAYVVSINASGGDGTDTPIAQQGDGTEASPFNVAAIVAKVKAMAADVESTQEYYIKGKVLSVSTTAATISQYGNHTFTMVDEGNNSTVFTAFQVYGPGKKKFTSVDDIKAGDEVVVCGKVVNYRGNTPETVGKGAAYVVSINNSGGGGGQSGDVQHITIAEFLERADANTTYELTGIVKNITNTTYGNFDLVEGDASIYIYGLLDLEGKTRNFSSLGIAEGDEVTLTGKYKLYNNKPEIESAQFISVKKGGGDGGGGEQGDVQHITIAEFLAKADANTTYELTGTVKNIVNTTYGNFDLVEDGASIYIYGLLDLSGAAQKFASLGIEEGDVVTLTGKYYLFNDKPEIKNAQFVSMKKGDGQGGETPPTPGPGGDPVSDLVNGDFESWVSASEPEGWKSASTASNATLGQSQDAHGGSYACIVNGDAASNKRLATQEMTLEAGSYTFSFYAKSTTGDICQTRAGYVPMKDDGTVSTYKYGDYTNITNTEWTYVSYEFELTSKTTLCLLVMNPKSSQYSISQSILVDDASLIKK